jgi:hypothetical protein
MSDQIIIRKTGKSYSILDKNNKPIEKKLKDVYLKFGIEDYNGNKILNIYIDRNNENYSNDEANDVKDIYHYVKEVSKFTKDPFNAKRYKFEGKGFKYPLKKKEEDGVKLVIIRTYLSRNVDITIKNMIGTLDTSHDISGYMADVELTIKTLWSTSTDIGVIIYTDSIKLNKKFS